MRQNLLILISITLLANCASRESVRNAEMLKSQEQSERAMQSILKNTTTVTIVDRDVALNLLNSEYK
jgi:uncharacterized lipoprotein YajG